MNESNELPLFLCFQIFSLCFLVASCCFSFVLLAFMLMCVAFNSYILLSCFFHSAFVSFQYAVMSFPNVQVRPSNNVSGSVEKSQLHYFPDCFPAVISPEFSQTNHKQLTLHARPGLQQANKLYIFPHV